MSTAISPFPPPDLATSPHAPELATREEAAKIIRVSVGTLAAWATPASIARRCRLRVFGKRCFYRRSDLDRFVASQFPSSSGTAAE